MAEVQDTNCVDTADTQRAQEVLGCCSCCAGAVDCTAPPAIGTLATQQAKPAVATLKGLTQLLSCTATHLGAEMRFRASDMALRINGDASCLSESKAQSRAAGHHCLSSHPDKLQGKPPPFNGSVNALCSTTREIVSSAAKAELGALFHNGKEACSIRTI
jgi:hypothetical protein